MAEQEVIKHTKKVLGTVRSKRKDWKHKAREILLEIAIIVFAVSLSIYLHNWSERRHDHHEELAFLEGLKTDLKSDIGEMQDDLDAYLWFRAGRKYFISISEGAPLQQDSLHKYEGIFFNITYLNPNVSRFEGLKGAGKLGIIENKELLNEILDLYQERIPFLNMLNSYYNDFRTRQIRPVIYQKLDYNAGKTEGNWEELLRSREMRNGLYYVSNVDEVIRKYTQTMDKIRDIISDIDKELK